MFQPKTYTLINKRYDPRVDIRSVCNQIREWVTKLDDVQSEISNIVFDNIDKYVDSNIFPVLDIPLYNETLEGWRLVTRRNKLEKEYPREFYQVLVEEKREIREHYRMMKEDNPEKW
jgi:ABC-type phosphate transport system auxiliary subunit